MKRLIKILVCMASLLAVSLVFAHQQYNIVHPGFYLGVEGGYSNVDYPNNFAPGYTAALTSNSGLATRIEGGFDINRYFGALLSVVFFHKPELHNINGPTSSKVKNNLVFFALRGMLPLSPRWAVYVNGGVGYVARSHVIVNGLEVFPDRLIVRPVYGLGLGYLIWKRWIATFSWLQSPEKSSENLPTANFLGLGIRYKFSS